MRMPRTIESRVRLVEQLKVWSKTSLSLYVVLPRQWRVDRAGGNVHDYSLKRTIKGRVSTNGDESVEEDSLRCCKTQGSQLRYRSGLSVPIRIVFSDRLQSSRHPEASQEAQRKGKGRNTYQATATQPVVYRHGKSSRNAFSVSSSR